MEKQRKYNKMTIYLWIILWKPEKIGLQNDRERQVNKKKTEKIAKDAEVKKRIWGG